MPTQHEHVVVMHGRPLNNGRYGMSWWMDICEIFVT